MRLGDALFLDLHLAGPPGDPVARGHAAHRPGAWGPGKPGCWTAWQRKSSRSARAGEPRSGGAGAKGVTLANLLDAQARRFDCIIDINPNKQGCFIAGTGHEILSLEDASARGVEAALLMNPNYRAEIAAMAPAMTFLEPNLTP